MFFRCGNLPVASVVCVLVVLWVSGHLAAGGSASSTSTTTLGKSSLPMFSDMKDLKNSVLLLFTKSVKQIPKKYVQMLDEVAKEATATGSLGVVDCVEGRKICKKLKIDPADWGQLYHFKDSEYNKEYDRPLTRRSLVSFLEDPSAEMPWEEDPTAADVVHLGSPASLTQIVHEQARCLVMFYAPWCAHCKRMKPEFAGAATDLRGSVALAAMDVDRPTNYEVRQQLNITGFPTLLYFENGKILFPYGGEHNRAGLIKWLADPQPPAPPVEEASWADDPETAVRHLTDSSFAEFFQGSRWPVLVMFYAPWCGHCKRMKPEFEKAASQLSADVGVLAAVDATREKDLAKKFEISGFPTVKYFNKDGELLFDLPSSSRTADAIVEFMKNPKEPPPPEPAWETIPSDVIHLNEENFAETLKRKKFSLVFFYAPWCGHCKAAKPHFQAAASRFRDVSKVALAAVDCTKHDSLCSKYDVRGFPTLIAFQYGDAVQKYQESGREQDDFVRFIQQWSGFEPSPAQPKEEL